MRTTCRFPAFCPWILHALLSAAILILASGAVSPPRYSIDSMSDINIYRCYLTTLTVMKSQDDSKHVVLMNFLCIRIQRSLANFNQVHQCPGFSVSIGKANANLFAMIPQRRTKHATDDVSWCQWLARSLWQPLVAGPLDFSCPCYGMLHERSLG